MTIDLARNARHDLSDCAPSGLPSCAPERSASDEHRWLDSEGNCKAFSTDDAERCLQVGDHGAPLTAAL